MNPERVKNVVFIFQILTDRHLKVLGDPSGNAYAIGDCADIKDFSLPCTAQVGFSNRGSYMSAHVLMNYQTSPGKAIKCQAFQAFYHFFPMN